MKKLVIALLVLVFPLVSFASDIEDNSIIEELSKENTKVLDFDFKLKSFESCDWLEKVMWDYIKEYYKNNKDRWYYPMYRTMEKWMMMEDMVMETAVEESANVVSDSQAVWGWPSDDFSKTNIQVDWVDESDIVKTDWKYIYYYNESDKFVYIVTASNLKVIKKIWLPKSFISPVLYIWENRLIIISNWYSDTNYNYNYWINRNSKTYTIVFDTTNIEKPILSKLYVSDWDLQKTRKIGDLVYVLSTNHFNIPYETFKSVDDIKIDSSMLLPQKIDISNTGDKTKQNLVLRWKNIPYNVTAWNVTKCSDIEYVLPDSETISKYGFEPSYNIISVIDTKNTEKEVKSNVIAWSNSEIYMSLENLYLTSNIYNTYNFSCPINARCFAPFYSRWSNTLLHKLNIENDVLKYQDSTIIPWTPLTQYSMDEYKKDFRILTQTNNWNSIWNESHTDLYILDSDLNLKWSLNNLWDWEQFKSSRYIWDKLFLVTFEQIDPLYAIDVSDSANPKILWELKMPWYSTYLHPYDENHLIWLWYDTKENKWWWITNAWLKVDLYEIDYDKKCGDSNLTDEEEKKCYSWDYKWIIVKQKYSYTMWDSWSYSEALNNPRMFMWKALENKLFLPASIRKVEEESNRITDFFNWLIAITIDKDKWIKENYRITHIDTIKSWNERNEECSKFTQENLEKKCVKLIGWWEYCEDVKYTYVPKYCYADSTIWEYLGSKNWQYRNSFVKRALWIDSNLYSISDEMILSSNMDTWEKVLNVNLNK